MVLFAPVKDAEILKSFFVNFDFSLCFTTTRNDGIHEVYDIAPVIIYATASGRRRMSICFAVFFVFVFFLFFCFFSVHQNYGERLNGFS